MNDHLALVVDKKMLEVLNNELQVRHKDEVIYHLTLTHTVSTMYEKLPKEG